MNRDEFEMNDEVWDLKYGHGIVREIFSGSIEFNIFIAFDNGYKMSYNQEGKTYTDVNRTLFFEEIKIPESAYKKPRWRAESGGEYFLVSSIGDIYSARDNYYEIDDLHFKTKNYFASEQQAKESKFYKVFHEEE